MKCDELEEIVLEDGIGQMWKCYNVDEVKDAIAELKQKLMPCLNGDCILTCEVVEKYGKENAELKEKLEENDKDIAYWREEYDKETKLTDALNAEIESLKASHYAESVDAGMENRILKRELWLARANSAEGQFIYWCARFAAESGFTKTDIRGYTVNTKRRLRTIGEWIEMWKNVKIKCRAKAEEYK